MIKKKLFLFSILIYYLSNIVLGQTRYDTLIDLAYKPCKINLFGENHYFFENFELENSLLLKASNENKKIISIQEYTASELYYFLLLVNNQDTAEILNLWPSHLQDIVFMKYFHEVKSGQPIVFIPIDIDNNYYDIYRALSKMFVKYKSSFCKQNMRNVYNLYHNSKKQEIELIQNIQELNLAIMNEGILSEFDSVWLIKINNSLVKLKEFLLKKGMSFMEYREGILMENLKSSISTSELLDTNNIVYGFVGWGHVNTDKIKIKKSSWNSFAYNLKHDSILKSHVNTVGVIYNLQNPYYRKQIGKLFQNKLIANEILQNNSKSIFSPFINGEPFNSIIYCF